MSLYKINNAFFDVATRTVSDNKNDIIKLSKSEVYILIHLIGNQGKIINKRTLIAVGWPRKVVVVNSLTVAISHLRKALQDPDAISSNKGIGYTLSTRVRVEFQGDSEKTDGNIVDTEQDIADNHSLTNATTSRPSVHTRNCLDNHPVAVNLMMLVSIVIFICAICFASNWLSNYVSS